jgi:hypothetical protein
MVVRNAALRMNGFSVSGWHDVVDPERSRTEIVEAQNVGGGLDLEKSLAGGLNIVP